MALALRTPRLLLRQWRDEDAAHFAAMSADPCLTEFLLPPSPDWVERARHHWDEYGFGQFALELPGECPFIGSIGLDHLRWAVPFAPAVEIAWRLARPYWGCGYATEAARAALEDGFYRLGFEEIVAFTVVDNQRSRRVMERLGMVRDTDGDFDHPRVPVGHPHVRHVLYRLRRHY
jgi:RimJ/RimL family protein N-acetyltransferase